jgi:ACS family hexuronate transporter-like MFS transporter
MESGFSRSQKIACLSGLFLAWAVGYADRILMSVAIIPISHELALDARQAGMLLSAFYVSYALMQLAGGWLSDRYGSRIVVVLCIVMWSVFTSTTSLAWSFASLLVIRFLFGIGEGSFSPASSVTVAEVFPESERARAKSFLISTVFLGNAAGAGLIGATVAYLGWRGSFHILSAAGFAVALVLWVALRSGISAQRERAANRPQQPWGSLLRSSMAWKLTAIWSFTSLLYVGVQSWMPSYLMKTYGIGLEQVGLATMMPNLIAFAGTNLVGLLLDKHGKGRERIFMVLGALFSAIFLALMMTTATIYLLLIYWTLLLLAFNFVYATVFAAPLRHFPEHLIGSATGLMNFGGQIGGSIAPVAMGALIAATGGSYLAAFCLLLASAVTSAVIAITWRATGDPVVTLQLAGAE